MKQLKPRAFYIFGTQILWLWLIWIQQNKPNRNIFYVLRNPFLLCNIILILKICCRCTNLCSVLLKWEMIMLHLHVFACIFFKHELLNNDKYAVKMIFRQTTPFLPRTPVTYSLTSNLRYPKRVMRLWKMIGSQLGFCALTLPHSLTFGAFFCRLDVVLTARYIEFIYVSISYAGHELVQR